MNRAQRRAAAKHARRAKPARTLYQRTLQKVAGSLAGLQLLDDARPFDAGDTTDQHIKTRFAFGRLCDGTAGDDDFDRVAIAINLAKVACKRLGITYSISSCKSFIHNAYMLERFICVFGISPDPQVIDKLFKELILFTARAA